MSTASTTIAPAAEVAEVSARLQISITRLARILRHQDRDGLTPSMMSALATLNREGPMPLGELAAREHVAAPSVTRIVEKLHREGLVRRAPSQLDGRVVVADVTDEGRSRIEEARSRRTAWMRSRIERLPARDLEIIRRAAAILERLVEEQAGGAA